MTTTVYYIICALLSLFVLLGISMMAKVKTSVKGNLLSAISLFAGIIVTLIKYDIFSISTIYIFIAIGLFIGYIFSSRVKMIQMPQVVALFNGVGGAASAFVGALSLLGIGNSDVDYIRFSNVTSSLALVIGLVTLIGSFVAAAKLHKILPQKPIIWKGHSFINFLTILIAFSTIILSAFIGDYDIFLLSPEFLLSVAVVFSSIFGLSFAIRVGGADMPITISLLNSLSGVAGAIAGMAIGDIILVSVGGIVGASGLLLTQIMCRAMNRNLFEILMGKTSAAASPKSVSNTEQTPVIDSILDKPVDELLREAKSVIIVPGYGMALAQAQHQVRMLADKLAVLGADVRYAIHPVAGRMPGHMNVLLAEADVPYEKLYEMDVINDDFKNTDVVIVVGANDVLNPAARDAEGTPIYGMPVLNVDECPNIVICNFDTNPGYAGVENPLYSRINGVRLLLGDAKSTLIKLIDELNTSPISRNTLENKDSIGLILKEAKSIIIVPGYGMALAQAQHKVRMLADKLEGLGASVRYAIHPVAGRMPGHMNVLLAEADVPYEKLYEMDVINDDFKNTDVVIVVGANDVLNPAARDAEGTPIYGMPVLNVDECPNIVICNFDTNPGYAGVENPLYTREEGVYLLLGDANDSLNRLMDEMNPSNVYENIIDEKDEIGTKLVDSKSVVIVPGYGMALAQAQHQVRMLADKLEGLGASVRYAIHPVAGRMPGHMNVLLAEADVPYEKLYEMDAINDDFENTDLVIVIGANDVINPAARDAEGTPIYGMPVLNVDKCSNIIICNFDTNPGYAGVDNPLYMREKGVHVLLGDAKLSLTKLMEQIN